MILMVIRYIIVLCDDSSGWVFSSCFSEFSLIKCKEIKRNLMVISWSLLVCFIVSRLNSLSPREFLRIMSYGFIAS